MMADAQSVMGSTNKASSGNGNGSAFMSVMVHVRG
jgi:hypothetical protein